MAEDADTGDLNARTLQAAQSARARAEAAMKAAQAAADAADLAEVAAAEAQASMDEWTSVPEPVAAGAPNTSAGGTAVAAEPAKDATATATPDVDAAASGTDDDLDDAPVDPDDEAAGDSEAPIGGGRFARLRHRPSRIGVGAAAMVVVLGLAIALNVVLFTDKRDHDSSQDQRVAMIQAAKQGVVNMTTIDYTRAAQDVQRVIDGSTGSFRDEFSGRKASFVDVVQKSKVSTKGETGDAGIEKMNSDGSAVVLVSASSKVTNGAGAKDEARAWRLRVTVTPDDGQLKMSKVDFVP